MKGDLLNFFCKFCGDDFSWVDKGCRKPVYCSDKCKGRASRERQKARTPEPAAPAPNLTCTVCGDGFYRVVRKGRAPVACGVECQESIRGCKWCGESCAKKFCREACRTAEYNRRNNYRAELSPEQKSRYRSAAKARSAKAYAEKVAAMKAGGTYKHCANCGGDMTQHSGRTYCGEPACREVADEVARLANNESSRRSQRRYREKTGLSSSARYRGRPYNKNYNYRERHPDRAKHYDHVRRARMANCERESFSDSEIFERDGFVCGICDEPVDMGLRYPDAMSASLDHVIPLSRGGGHVRANVRLAHMGCNARKCARLDDEMAVSG